MTCLTRAVPIAAGLLLCAVSAHAQATPTDAPVQGGADSSHASGAPAQGEGPPGGEGPASAAGASQEGAAAATPSATEAGIAGDAAEDGATTGAAESSTPADAAAAASEGDPDPAQAPAAPGPASPVAATSETLLEFVQQAGAAAPAPCVAQGALVHDGFGYVACGTAGVWVCRHAPRSGWRLEEVVAVQGMAVGVWLRAGQLHVDVVQTGSAPLGILRAHPDAAQAKTCNAPRVRYEELDGLVLRFEALDAHCLRWRDRVALHDADGQVLSVARVRRGRSGGIEVALGYHERVDASQVHSLAGVSHRLTSSPLAPLRGAPFWLVRVFTNVLLSGGPTGGLTGEVAIERLFERKAFIRAEASPVGFAGGESRSDFFFREASEDPLIGAAAGVVLAGLDLRLFSMGTGLGFSTVNVPREGQGTPSGTGTTIPLFFRFGARDGIHLALRGDTTIFFGQAQYTLIDGRLSFPLNHRSALQFRGRGGPVGLNSGEIVTRLLTRGNGGPKSTFVEFGIGGGNLTRDLCEQPSNAGEGGFEGCVINDSVSYSGVTFGVGIEQRF